MHAFQLTFERKNSNVVYFTSLERRLAVATPNALSRKRYHLDDGVPFLFTERSALINRLHQWPPINYSFTLTRSFPIILADKNSSFSLKLSAVIFEYGLP